MVWETRSINQTKGLYVCIYPTRLKNLKPICRIPYITGSLRFSIIFFFFFFFLFAIEFYLLLYRTSLLHNNGWLVSLISLTIRKYFRMKQKHAVGGSLIKTNECNRWISCCCCCWCSCIYFNCFCFPFFFSFQKLLFPFHLVSSSILNTRGTCWMKLNETNHVACFFLVCYKRRRIKNFCLAFKCSLATFMVFFFLLFFFFFNQKNSFTKVLYSFPKKKIIKWPCVYCYFSCCCLLFTFVISCWIFFLMLLFFVIVAVCSFVRFCFFFK